MVLVEAKVVDSTHLELSKPIQGPEGRTVFVSVSESIAEDAERRIEEQTRGRGSHDSLDSQSSWESRIIGRTRIVEEV